MTLTVEEYRERVITAVGCPACGAKVNHGCTKPVRFYLKRSSVALRYVHDERCAFYDRFRDAFRRNEQKGATT